MESQIRIVKGIIMKRLLVVDDDHNVRLTLSLALKSEGFVVESAGDAQEALTKVRSNSYECVISDINMPQMNGIELVKVAKKEQPGLRFILISGYHCDDDLEEDDRRLIVALLEKPVDLTRLKGLIVG